MSSYVLQIPAAVSSFEPVKYEAEIEAMKIGKLYPTLNTHTSYALTFLRSYVLTPVTVPLFYHVEHRLWQRVGLPACLFPDHFQAPVRDGVSPLHL